MKDLPEENQTLTQEVLALKQRIKELGQAQGNLQSVVEGLRQSEARWQFALDGAGDGLWAWDAVTNHVYYSPRWKTMLGYGEKEIGDTLDEWDRRVHPDDKANVYSELERCFRGETSHYESSHRLLCKDGSYKWILDRGKIVEWTADGRPRRVVGTHTDITDRVQAEESLRRSEARCKALLESIGDAVYILDREGYFVFVNDVLVERSGQTREWFSKRHYLDVTGPEDKERAQAIFEAEMGGEVLPPHEKIVVYPSSGRKLWVEVNRRPLLDGTHVVGVLGVSRDITRRKKLEGQLKRHQDHLEEIVEERTRELQSSKEELEIKARELEAANMALKVLLRQRDDDKKELEDRLASNMRRLILPYFEKVKDSRLDAQTRSYLGIMETNLNEIVSPFLHTLTRFNLTPKETQVASLIKDGKTTKEIAKVMGVSPKSIDIYRNRIRKKMNLNKRKTNLQIYLQSVK